MYFTSSHVQMVGHQYKLNAVEEIV